MSPLRYLLVLCALTNFAVVSLHAQTTYPYNPDDNADGFIQVYDLQSFLTLYGQEFQPTVPEDSLTVVTMSSLPNGVSVGNNVDVLDNPQGQNNWVYLPNPNSTSAHRIAVLHGGNATVQFMSQTGSYRVLVSEGYENSNSHNVSILMPFMGKWFVGR